MKSLTLSKEQRDKLLEMCEKLFPEYKWFDGDFFRKGHLDIYNHGTEMCPNWTIYSHSIHWFEFCMIYLFSKVCNFMDAEQLSDFYYVTIGYNHKIFENKAWNYDRFIHPVDYLYKEFLKLK